MYTEICSLFDDGVSLSLEKGEVLFSANEPVKFIYLVKGGTMELVRYTSSGTRLVLARVNPGHVLAEASAYSEAYHCDGLSSGQSRVKCIPMSEFRKKLTSDASIQYIWAKALAHELHAARVNAEVRTLRTVTERLDVWLESNTALPPKGQLQDLAQVLGITREALYRELSRRRG